MRVFSWGQRVYGQGTVLSHFHAASMRVRSMRGAGLVEHQPKGSSALPPTPTSVGIVTQSSPGVSMCAQHMTCAGPMRLFGARGVARRLPTEEAPSDPPRSRGSHSPTASGCSGRAALREAGPACKLTHCAACVCSRINCAGAVICWLLAPFEPHVALPALCGSSSRRRLEQSSALREAALVLTCVALASVSFGKSLA